MSSNIQHVNSCPDYINKFIHLNMEQLCKIYDEGMELNPELEAIDIEASKLNKERNRIINSPGIDGAEKRQQIDVIEQKLLMLFQKTMQNVKNLDLKVNDPFFKFGGFQSKGGPSIEIGSFKLGGNK